MSRRHRARRDAEAAQLCPVLDPRPGYHGPCHKGHAACVRGARQLEARDREKARKARQEEAS